MPSILCKIQCVHSPIVSDFRGYRLLFASPNIARSFEKPYYLLHFGDYPSIDDLLEHAPNMQPLLARMGFSGIEMVQEKGE